MLDPVNTGRRSGGDGLHLTIAFANGSNHLDVVENISKTSLSELLFIIFLIPDGKKW